MREFDVVLTMINNTKWKLPFSFFVTAGIVDRAEAVIGNAVRGSNSPALLATPVKADGSDGDVKDSEFIVAQNIVSFKVNYK